MSTVSPAVQSGKKIDVARAATLLEVSCATVRRYIEEGVIKGVRFTPRGKYRVYYDSVIDLLNRSEESPPT